MATNPPVPPVPGASAPAGMPPKKSNTLAWVLGGLGGCLVLVVIIVACVGFFVLRTAKKHPALAVAKIMTATNHDIEMVSVDEGRQELTVRDKKSGKTYTMSVEDAKNGKFTMKEDGKTTLIVGGKAKLPSWVPDYPGSDPQGAFTAAGADGGGGSFTFKTRDGSDKGGQYYQDQFKTVGIKVTNHVTNQDGQSSAGIPLAHGR